MDGIDRKSITVLIRHVATFEVNRVRIHSSRVQQAVVFSFFLLDKHKHSIKPVSHSDLNIAHVTT
jgi:hypothetical protein